MMPYMAFALVVTLVAGIPLAVSNLWVTASAGHSPLVVASAEHSPLAIAWAASIPLVMRNPLAAASLAAIGTFVPRKSIQQLVV